MDVGDKVPDLTLLNEDEESVSLRGLKDQPTVLFFYPKADTPG
jgi:peroxiredoxin Q/BCP